MTFSFRPGTYQDVGAMFELDRLCFDEPFAFDKMTFRHLMRSRGTISVVAEGADGVPAGFAILKKESLTATCLYTIDVHPKLRRKGLGKELLTRALKSARGKGLFKTYLQVYVENDAAIAFYLGFGYRIEGRLPDFYASGADALLMSLEIQFPAEIFS